MLPIRQSTHSRKAIDIYNSLDYNSRGRYIGYINIILKALYFMSLYKVLQAYNIDSKFLHLEEELLELVALLANPSIDL